MTSHADALKKRALVRVEACTDPGELRQMAENARRAGAPDVEQAASLRLYEILPAEAPGTLQHDVWRSIFALEDSLSRERGKTTRLSRTRQKIGRDGETETVRALVMGNKESEGFRMLLERNLRQLTFEAVALRHEEAFAPETLAAARARLDGLAPESAS